MTEVPGYWMHETSGVLRPVVERYLAGDELDADALDVMRVYVRQWIAAPFHDVDDLRRRVDEISTTAELREWMHDALDRGIDPL